MNKKPTKAQQAKLFTAEMKALLLGLRRVYNLKDWNLRINVGDKEVRFRYLGTSKRQATKEFRVIQQWWKTTTVIPTGVLPVRV